MMLSSPQRTHVLHSNGKPVPSPQGAVDQKGEHDSSHDLKNWKSDYNPLHYYLTFSENENEAKPLPRKV